MITVATGLVWHRSLIAFLAWHLKGSTIYLAENLKLLKFNNNLLINLYYQLLWFSTDCFREQRCLPSRHHLVSVRLSRWTSSTTKGLIGWSITCGGCSTPPWSFTSPFSQLSTTTFKCYRQKIKLMSHYELIHSKWHKISYTIIDWTGRSWADVGFY